MPRPVMNRPNLDQIEDALVHLAISAISDLASTHPDERFYAFGLDCHAEHGQILLCASTEEYFQQISVEYVQRWNYSPSDLADLRRNFGDWKYQGFNDGQAHWEQGWQPVQQAIGEFMWAEDEDEEAHEQACQEFIEEFLCCACRALVRVEQSKVLERLQREPGFFTLVMDHDEDPDEAMARMHQVRSAINAP